MLVEDEPLIRMVTAEGLRDAGFDVDEAANAAEAIATIRRPGVHLDAAIIDIGLPDRPGDDLAMEIWRSWSDLPILIASGRARNEVARLFEGGSVVDFIGKPYSNDQLISALAAVGIVANASTE